MMTDLERSFATLWAFLGGPGLVHEHRFAPPRRWRFDFAHVGAMVAVELEGGIHTGGRHVRGRGFEADCEKYNAATAAGWAVYRLTAGMLVRDPVGALTPIIGAVRERLDQARPDDDVAFLERVFAMTPRASRDPKDASDPKE